MKKLCEVDYDLKKETCKAKLHSIFRDCLKGNIDSVGKKNKTLNNVIREYYNYDAYLFHQNERQEIAGRINGLFNQCYMFLESFQDFQDSTEFVVDYIQNIFELVVAAFLSLTFNFKENRKGKSLADLEFEHKDKKYYLECTTRNTNRMDEWAKSLQHFESYFQVASIFRKKYEDLKKQDRIWPFCVSGLEETYIEPVWYHFDEKTKLNIKRIMNIPEESELFPLIKSWINSTRYACLYFGDILPPEILEQLSSISFPMGSSSGQFDERHLIKGIALQIKDKLRKKYFNEETPIILAISFATLRDYMPMFSMEHFLSYQIKNLLQNELKKLLSNESDFEELFLKIKKLYAIIINITWYDWFPAIAKNLYGSTLEKGKNNYGIIYNSNFSPSIEADQRIFDQLIENRIELDFNISI